MRRSWFGLAFVVVAFLAFSVPPYAALDPQASRLPIDEHTAWHYPVLVGHILFGTIALVACVMQVWPWLRRRHPTVHRLTGRIYVFAGVVPTAVLAVFAAFAAVVPGFSGRVGNITLAVVWLAVTAKGFLAARGGRYGEHRRWMIRSFALCTSIIVNRFWVFGLIVGLSPFVDSGFDGDQQAMIQASAEAAIWLSWIVNLLIAEWWLERRRSLDPADRPRRTGSLPDAGRDLLGETGDREGRSSLTPSAGSTG